MGDFRWLCTITVSNTPTASRVQSRVDRLSWLRPFLRGFPGILIIAD